MLKGFQVQFDFKRFIDITLLMLVGIGVLLFILPDVSSVYWHIWNDNPVVFGRWEARVPSGWAAHTSTDSMHIYRYRRFLSHRYFDSIIIELADPTESTAIRDDGIDSIESIKEDFVDEIKLFAMHAEHEVLEQLQFPVAGHMAVCLEIGGNQNGPNEVEALCYVAESGVRFHFVGDPDNLTIFYEILNYFELRNVSGDMDGNEKKQK